MMRMSKEEYGMLILIYVLEEQLPIKMRDSVLVAMNSLIGI